MFCFIKYNIEIVLDTNHNKKPINIIPNATQSAPKTEITKINVSIQKFLLLIKIFALDVIVVFRVFDLFGLRVSSSSFSLLSEFRSPEKILFSFGYFYF